MIDADIHRLDERESLRGLDRLETDIWTGVTARTGARKAGWTIASYQAAVMATAVAGSVIVGAMTAASVANSPNETLSFSSRTVLTPATLLLGSHR